MSWSFWFKIVSMATDVLPVLRSPMINSRCPRPIGTKASTAFKPVCSGSKTDLRSITPGAFTSTGRVLVVLIGPIPSIGWPNALTTRPINPSPTGTSMIRPVRLTVSPSRISSYLPKIMIPTSLDSRFCAIPNTPFSNSTNSPARAFSKPVTRAIPSPT